MKIIKSNINNIQFYHREGYSDLKTFEEVIRNKTYLKKGMTIKAGEKWMDCGGNVGAFALLACSYGADVTIYEPDPYSCDMIKKNLKLNGFKAEIKQAALVNDNRKEVILFVGNNKNVWRNSIIKKWNNKGIKVPCLNFDIEAKKFDCCKMDIEGAEMLILEKTNKVFKKLVYEWSFDIDNSLTRFWNIIEKHQKEYSDFIDIGNTGKFKTRDYDTWQKSWFPHCTNVFAFNNI
jgi:FkbM family methyltransferase